MLYEFPTMIYDRVGENVSEKLETLSVKRTRTTHKRANRQPLWLLHVRARHRSLLPQLATCRIVDLSGGLKTAQHILRKTDVLVSPHGGDMTNALALHDRA